MRLAVFDLDYTIWQPEMYQLWGPPKLAPLEKHPKLFGAAFLEEMRTNRKGMILIDKHNTPLRVFDGASFALSEINRFRADGQDIQAAISSRTDEPRWARICLNHLVVEDGTTLKDFFPEHLREIGRGSKADAIKRLHCKTGIPFCDICFFDNEHYNIQDVTRKLPEVKCSYTPDGMTRTAWEEAKAHFGM